MAQERSAFARMQERKRVDITPKNYLTRCQRVLIAELLLTGIISGSVLYFLGVTFLTLGISVSIMMVCAAICLYIRNKTKAVAVKGDNLILNSFDNRSLVTSLRSIKSVHTSHLLIFHYTSLQFKLDGIDRKTIMINRPWAVEARPDVLIKKAIALSKENREKKANHKLGSVAV